MKPKNWIGNQIAADLANDIEEPTDPNGFMEDDYSSFDQFVCDDCYPDTYESRGQICEVHLMLIIENGDEDA